VTLKKLGATIVDPLPYPDYVLKSRGGIFLTVLNADFKAQIAGYLKNLRPVIRRHSKSSRSNPTIPLSATAAPKKPRA